MPFPRRNPKRRINLLRPNLKKAQKARNAMLKNTANDVGFATGLTGLVLGTLLGIKAIITKPNLPPSKPRPAISGPLKPGLVKNAQPPGKQRAVAKPPQKKKKKQFKIPVRKSPKKPFPWKKTAPVVGAAMLLYLSTPEGRKKLGQHTPYIAAGTAFLYLSEYMNLLSRYPGLWRVSIPIGMGAAGYEIIRNPKTRAQIVAISEEAFRGVTGIVSKAVDGSAKVGSAWLDLGGETITGAKTLVDKVGGEASRAVDEAIEKAKKNKGLTPEEIEKSIDEFSAQLRHDSVRRLFEAEQVTAENINYLLADVAAEGGRISTRDYNALADKAGLSKDARRRHHDLYFDIFT